jgi:o-succinylbenzoate synthase
VKIHRAAIVTAGGNLPVPVGNAGATYRERRALVLRLFDDDGRMGQGEASPLPGYSPDDDLERVRQALSSEPWRTLRSIDERAPLIPQVRHVTGLIDPGLPSARFAIETALLDLLGQRAGRPVHDILSGGAPAGTVALSRLVDAEAIDGLLAAARAAQEAGIRTLKVKIGRRFEAELAMLRGLRSELGYGLALRLDANRSFPSGEAKARLAALVGIAPELIEEPVPPDELERVHPSPIPIALDESLAGDEGPARLSRLAAAGVCKWVILKPTLLGGAIACIEVARRARAAGVEPIVSHTFEGPIAMAAAAALAVALPPPRHAAGLDRHPGLIAFGDVEVRSITATHVVPDDAPGLAVTTGPTW